MNPLFRIGLAMLVLAATLSLCPAALAWQNGRSTRALGDTTVQQWVLAQAISQAVRSGSDWVDPSAALQTVRLPDTVVHDYRYHACMRWGSGHKGAAPERAAVYFALVRDALQAGDAATASRLLGMLTHYYTDACDPLHTGASRNERRMHRRFERDVMALLNAHGRFEGHLQAALAASYQQSAKGAAHEASVAAVGQDVVTFTATSAKRAHHAYRTLVRGYLRRGFTRAASRIAASTLQRSVQGVASLIEAAAQPSSFVPAPSSGSPALLSKGCAATASSENVLYHAARFANDGDRSSPWVAAVGGYPQWWQVDLGETRELGSIAIEWLKGSSRSYTYDIRVSADGRNFRLLADQCSRGAFGSSSDSLAGVRARYVRVNILGYGVGQKPVKDAASAGPAAISESRVYGPAAPSPDPTPTPTPTPTATATPTPTPTPTATPTPVQGTVAVPSGATQAQIDACITRAVAAGKGTRLEFPAGVFAYSGTLVVPDGISMRGQGVWDQGLAAGGGGTWLQCSKGMNWGSHSTIEQMLLGKNTAGLTCGFRPVARGSASAGADTQANGSHGCVFNFVRFKGGSDAGDDLIGTGSNYSNSWSAGVKRCDLVDTTFNDCEFERPQISNAAAGTQRGTILNLWWDVRPGGAQVHDLTFRRCHFGVMNGYHSGVDGYGCGRTILFQGAPSSSDSTGPGIGGGSTIDSANWNADFDWRQVDHGCYNVVFEDCLFEYSLWYPMNICDFSRPYSMWHGVQAGADDGGASIGWGNPPGSHHVDIPAGVWTNNVDITRCYFKGSYPDPHSVVFEIGRNCNVLDSYSGTAGFGNHAGKYGNTTSGSFSNALRPRTAMSTTDWNGAQTAYTPSPYDP